MKKDVIIIGGGVAGISAGKWCAELGLSALVLERDSEPGGQLLWIYNPINNYLGAAVNNGKDLRDLMIRELEDPLLEFRFGANITAIDLKEKRIELAGGAKMNSKAIIIAAGVRRRKLNVPGEAEFAGRGLLVSGARDREKARGKDVVIVGGGDAAFENALMLVEVARSVTLIHRSSQFRARAEFRKKVADDKRIKILTDTVVEAIEGGEGIEQAKVRNVLKSEVLTILTQAVLIRIGVEPNSEFFHDQIELNEDGFIVVNERCEASVEDVYAVGDIAHPDSMTISTAAGTGATAAHMIRKKFA